MRDLEARVSRPAVQSDRLSKTTESPITPRRIAHPKPSNRTQPLAPLPHNPNAPPLNLGAAQRDLKNLGEQRIVEGRGAGAVGEDLGVMQDDDALEIAVGKGEVVQDAERRTAARAVGAYLL